VIVAASLHRVVLRRLAVKAEREARMLQDKLVIRSLATYEPPLLEPLVNLGRIFTSAGEIAQIANGSPIRFIAYIEFAQAGVVRANHYHLRRNEWLYLLKGSLLGRFIDSESGESCEQVLHAGDLVLMLPGCAHAYRALEPTQTIELADQPYDDSDRVVYSVLETEK
jgi:oxalate decarboxylase/phosphoglucose isomerase-like protein (cupin superfamily)